MTYYLDEVMPSRVHPNTLRDYRKYNDLWITPALGKKRLTQITGDDIHKLVRRLGREPKSEKIRALPVKERPEKYATYSASYVRAVFNVISGSFKEAVRRGKAFHNPCEQTDRPEVAKSDEKALTPAQARKLLEHIAERPDAALWATYLLTGARRAEVIGLEIDRAKDGTLDFSWQLQDIHDVSDVPARWEHRHVRGNLYLTRPKTSSGWRVVPMLPIVQALIERSIGSRREGFVFLHPSTGEAWRPDTAYKAWCALLKDAGLPHVKLHGTRHTFIDLLFDAGVSESVITELVGHSTRAMSRSYRTRGADSLKLDAVSRVGKLLELDATK
jgi:integrase